MGRVCGVRCALSFRFPSAWTPNKRQTPVVNTFRPPHVLQLEDALEVERFNREAVQRRLDQQTREAEEAHKHLQRENTQLNEQLAVRQEGRLSV